MDTYSNSTTLAPNSTTPGNGTIDTKVIPFCKQILVEGYSTKNASVRWWDLAIILPNLVFFAFLAYKLRRIIEKLNATRTPLFRVFFAIVYFTCTISIIRCVVSMFASASNVGIHTMDKLLWLLLRWALLAAELSFLTFALMFGHLDSSSSLKRVLIITITISGVFSGVQGVMEFKYHDTHYAGVTQEFDLFSHGGMLFWAITSILCSIMYAAPLVIPHTPLRRWIAVPRRRRFYVYCASMAMLNLVQVLGAILIFRNHMIGMCVVDLTSYLYFSGFAPVVYLVFLKNFVPDAAMGDQFFAYRRHKDDSQPLDDADDVFAHGATPTQYYQRFNSSRGLRVSAGGRATDLEDSVQSTSTNVNDWMVQSDSNENTDDANIVTHRMDDISMPDDDLMRTAIVSPNPLYDYSSSRRQHRSETLSEEDTTIVGGEMKLAFTNT